MTESTPPDAEVIITTGRHGNGKVYHTTRCSALDAAANTRRVERAVLPHDMRHCKVCEQPDRPKGAYNTSYRDALLQTDPDDVPGLRSDGGTRRVACPWCGYDDGQPAVGRNLCSDCGDWFTVTPDGDTHPVGKPVPDGGRPLSLDEASIEEQLLARLEDHYDGLGHVVDADHLPPGLDDYLTELLDGLRVGLDVYREHVEDDLPADAVREALHARSGGSM